MRYHLVLSGLALAVSLSAGCMGDKSGIEEDAVATQGKVTNAGQPLTTSDPVYGYVEVVFISVPEGDKPPESFTARADASGSFSVAGKLGEGIPPGKYRIAVRQWDPWPDTDKLERKFDEQNTKIVREVTGEGDINIDVSKPEG